MQHHTAVVITPCTLADVPPNKNGVGTAVERSIFLHPMAPRDVVPAIRNLNEGGNQEQDSEETIFPNAHKIPSSDIWEESVTMPEWMKRYFRWHKEQRRKLNQSNWRDFCFLVMECVEGAAVQDQNRIIVAPALVAFADGWVKPKATQY